METSLQSTLEFISIITSGDISVIQSASQLFYDAMYVYMCVCTCDKPKFIDLEWRR